MRRYIVIALIVLFIGCNSEQTETTTSGNLRLYIPESVAPAMIDQVNAFLALYSQNGAHITYKIVTSNAAAQYFIEDSSRIAFLTSPLTQSDIERIRKRYPELNSLIIAYDGIAAIVSQENRTDQISTTDLKNILTGKITKWNQLKNGGSNGKIRIYYQDSSDISCYLGERLSGISTGFIRTNSQIQTAQLVAKDPLSIGFLSSAWVDSAGSAVKILKLGRTSEDTDTSFVPPPEAKGNFFILHPAYILKNYYPLKRAIYMYTRGRVDLAAGFATFVATYEGQKLLLDRGILPGTQKIKLKFSGE